MNRDNTVCDSATSWLTQGTGGFERRQGSTHSYQKRYRLLRISAPRRAGTNLSFFTLKYCSKLKNRLHVNRVDVFKSRALQTSRFNYKIPALFCPYPQISHHIPSIFTSMKGAIVEKPGAPVKVVDNLEVPEPAEDQMLVKPIYAALNPV